MGKMTLFDSECTVAKFKGKQALSQNNYIFSVLSGKCAIAQARVKTLANTKLPSFVVTIKSQLSLCPCSMIAQFTEA